jgi:23S rRNA (uracil1939-C5)-methyltransferase
MEQYVSFVIRGIEIEGWSICMKQEAPVKKNETYCMKITDIGLQGQGIGRIDGFTVFVEGGLPGETIEVLIVKVQKHMAYGKVLRILEPSESRVEPPCSVASVCGGCQLQHLSYEKQLEWKQSLVQKNLERIGGIKDVEVLPTIGMKEPLRYRNKAQFPVGKKQEKLQIGFYANRSHRIVDTDVCLLQHPVNDEIVQIIRDFLTEYHIEPYQEETQKGLVRHILTRIGKATGEVMVCLVLNGKSLPHDKHLVERLKKITGMTSIVLNENMENTNVILGEKIQVLWGKPYIRDYIGPIQFEISPLSFYQVNPEQTQVIYEKALEFADLKGEEVVLDIYCGIGTISLFLAQKAKEVIGVEVIPQAIEDARRNAEINGIKNARFFVGKAEQIIPMLYEQENIKPDVIVVDPPRKGCDFSVLNTIIKMQPQKVVYVSCDSATLARDLSILEENGFCVKKVQPVDQFGMTTHVECVVLMSRVNK